MAAESARHAQWEREAREGGLGLLLGAHRVGSGSHPQGASLGGTKEGAKGMEPY